MKKDITELFCNVDDFCRAIDVIEKSAKIGQKNDLLEYLKWKIVKLLL